MPKGTAGDIRGYSSVGHYIQGPGVIRELPGIVARCGRSAMMLIDSFFGEKELHLFEKLFAQTDVAVHFQSFSGECSEEEVERILRMMDMIPEGIQVLIGFGGGKTLDTMRCTAHYSGLPMILIPTSAASNAATSGLCVVYDKDHCSKDVFLGRNPEYVLVDTDYIIAAPARMLAAGIGDSLATYYEARNNWLANNINTVMPGYRPTLCGKKIAEACLETLLRYGRPAMWAAEQHICTDAVENIVEAINLLSGIGWENNGCSIAHGLVAVLPQIPETRGKMHGECVAFCVLVQLILDGAEQEEFDTVYRFCGELGLPVCLADIGIVDAPEKKALFLAEKAYQTQGIVKIANYPVTPQKIRNAILYLNSLKEKFR